jgi:hypothetical protein
MAVLEHLPIDRATIMQEGEARGHVQHDTFNMTDDEALDAGFLDFGQIRAEKNARVALAGEIAQTIHDAASVDPDHAESDRHQFGDMILRLASNGDEQEAYATLLRLQTENRLRAKMGRRGARRRAASARNDYRWHCVARSSLPRQSVIATKAALWGGFGFALQCAVANRRELHPGRLMLPQTLRPSLLDSLFALRLEYANGSDGGTAKAPLGRGKLLAVRTMLDTAIHHTKRIIGDVIGDVIRPRGPPK